MTFSFVDCITAIEANGRARGRCRAPGDSPLPACLMAEAVGQLAAWSAMAASDFRRRPVAGLAAEVVIHGEAPAGALLDLEVEIHDLDEASIAYRGAAALDGARLLELRDCFGPMLPADELADPQAMRRDFERLRGAGAASARSLEGLVDVAGWRPLDGEPGRQRRCELRIPDRTAPLFADHFPRRPVFPGTLLLHAEIRLAAELVAESFGIDLQDVQVRRIRNVKFRRFLPPGSVVTLRAVVRHSAEGSVDLGVEAESDGQRVAGARVELAARGTP